MKHAVCSTDMLVPETGVAAMVGEQQVALFRLADNRICAISNHDPFSGANVLARGITGFVRGHYVVASPIYKQHFCLETGQCLEDDSIQLKTWPVIEEQGLVYLVETGDA